jgi:hypothetical protein
LWYHHYQKWFADYKDEFDDMLRRMELTRILTETESIEKASNQEQSSSKNTIQKAAVFKDSTAG